MLSLWDLSFRRSNDFVLFAGANMDAESSFDKQTAFDLAESGKFHDICCLLTEASMKEHAI